MSYQSILTEASKLSRSNQLELIEELKELLNEPESKTVEEKKVYTIGQVAELLQASKKSVTKWFDSGKLRGYRIPGRRNIRIKHSELVKWLKQKNLHNLVPSTTSSTKCYTSGQAAKIIGVTTATVSRWVRRGELSGYYVAGSQDRRIEHQNLVKFATAHGHDLKKCA